MTTSKTQFRGISNLISIDRRASEPFYQQIYESFRNRIIRGGLRPGELVLSTRSLARSLRISRLPVLNAYAQLLAEGYFESRVGAGTFIASSLPGRTKAQTTKYALTNAGKRPIARNAAALPPYERPSWAERLGPFQVGQPDRLRIQTDPLTCRSRNTFDSGSNTIPQKAAPPSQMITGVDFSSK